MPHLIQARKALLEDPAATVPCGLGAITPPGVEVRPLRGEPHTVAVRDPEGLSRALSRTDLTRRQGSPLALVNERYRLLALAFGPAEAPSRLEFVVVVDLDSEPLCIPSPVEGEQPGWLLFDLTGSDSS